MGGTSVGHTVSADPNNAICSTMHAMAPRGRVNAGELWAAASPPRLCRETRAGRATEEMLFEPVTGATRPGSRVPLAGDFSPRSAGVVLKSKLGGIAASDLGCRVTTLRALWSHSIRTTHCANLGCSEAPHDKPSVSFASRMTRRDTIHQGTPKRKAGAVWGGIRRGRGDPGRRTACAAPDWVVGRIPWQAGQRESVPGSCPACQSVAKWRGPTAGAGGREPVSGPSARCPPTAVRQGGRREIAQLARRPPYDQTAAAPLGLAGLTPRSPRRSAQGIEEPAKPQCPATAASKLSRRRGHPGVRSPTEAPPHCVSVGGLR